MPSRERNDSDSPQWGSLKCIAHVPHQTDIGGTVKYTNIAGVRITVEANLTGIDYSHTKPEPFSLGACPSGSATNGALSARGVVSAETDPGGSPLSLFLS